ncbi:MAG: hypothetical protein J2P46_10770 [Zavarzinella sp.]|nr:hypothetical protein [Zavarzinella sp.]
MITPERRDILRLLEPLSELSTDMRFGQLICNLVTLAGGRTAEAIWDIEDDQLLAAIHKFTDDLTRFHADRAAEAAAPTV